MALKLSRVFLLSLVVALPFAVLTSCAEGSDESLPFGETGGNSTSSSSGGNSSGTSTSSSSSSSSSTTSSGNTSTSSSGGTSSSSGGTSSSGGNVCDPMSCLFQCIATGGCGLCENGMCVCKPDPLSCLGGDGGLPDFDGGLPDFDGGLPDFDGGLPDLDGALPDGFMP